MSLAPRPRPFHVAHVIGHMKTGGAERQLLNYLLASDRSEFRHTLVCMSPPGELAGIAAADGIPVVTLPVRTRYAYSSIRRYAQWFKREGVDVVHTHMHHAAMWGRLGAVFGRVPVIVTTEHGKELWKGPVRLTVDRVLSRFTDRHIVVSSDVIELRARREKVPREKMVLIPNGVPVRDDGTARPHRERIRGELGLDPGSVVIGSVGRIVKAKAYEDLLSALRLMREDIPEIVWLAVGEGDQRPALESMARDLGVAENVIWAGRRDDVPAVLDALDVWVMSSVREGLPVALLEAMAAGLPIVATNVGGIPDAVRDGQDGVLVDPGDPPAFASAVMGVLRDESLAARLASSAHVRAGEMYGIRSVARRIEDVYRAELVRRIPGADRS